MKIKLISLVLAILVLGSCTFFRNQHAIARNRERPLVVSLNSPNFQAGETEAQFDNPVPLAPMRKTGVSVSYFPLEDAVCLQYRIDMITFYQFWDREGRETFIRALDSYNRDYDARKLRRNRSGVTRKLYGNADGYLIWQSSSFTRRSTGNMEMELGYYFRNRAPFFTITQGYVIDVDYSQPDERKDDVSGEKPIFFTRAQATEIARAFDQEHLISLVPEALRNVVRNQTPMTPVEFDTY